MATHSSILAWRIPGEEIGGLQSTRLPRVRHNRATHTCTPHTHTRTYTHVEAHVHTCRDMHTKTHICTNTHEHTYRTQDVHDHAYACAHAHTYTDMHTHAGTQVANAHEHAYVCAWSCVHCSYMSAYHIFTHTCVHICVQLLKQRTNKLPGRWEGQGHCCLHWTLLARLELKPIRSLLAMWLLNSAQLPLEPKDASVIHQN